MVILWITDFASRLSTGRLLIVFADKEVGEMERVKSAGIYPIFLVLKCSIAPSLM